MAKEDVLKGKSILIVDDEPDVLEALEDELDMCIVDKAADYDTAIMYLQNYTYEIVILDIMGVRGFELLETAVEKGCAAVMLTAHALNPEALKRSIKYKALSYIPKDRMWEIRSFLVDVVLGGGRPVWKKVFDRLGAYFDEVFGPDWKQDDEFWEDFERKILRQGG